MHGNILEGIKIDSRGYPHRMVSQQVLPFLSGPFAKGIKTVLD